MMNQIYHLWQTMLYWIAPSTEPLVEPKIDRAGNTYFEIYDPATGKSNAFGSEQELLVWLDRSHH
jgi:hypothetical protein